MQVRFWGVRGSIPTPPTSEYITEKIIQIATAITEKGLSTETEVRDFVNNLPLPQRGLVGGNTTCIEIQSGDDLIIIDAGSGIRNLGLNLLEREFGRGQGVAHVFFTHGHWDHLLGWPYFLPAFIPGNTLHLYAVNVNPRSYLDYQQNAPRYFPVDLDYMRATKTYTQLEHGQTVELSSCRITNIELPHPGVSYGYRIEDAEGVFVFIGDAEFKNLDQNNLQNYIDFFRDADALAFDSAYSLRDVFFSKVDWGHSSAMIGVDMAMRANAKRLITFHHDIYTNDQQIWDIAKAASEYATLQIGPNAPHVEVIPGHEGLTLELGQPLHLKQIDNTSVVHLSSGLDKISAEKVRERLAEALHSAEGGQLVLDLTDLSSLDVAGLRPLLAAQGTLPDTAIAVVAPNKRVRRTLELVFGDETFNFFTTPEEAIRSFDTQNSHLQLANTTLARRYKLQVLAGQNSRMAVYIGTDKQLDQPIIAHVLNPNRSYNERNTHLSFARSWRRIHHTNLLAVLDVTTSAGEQAVILETPMGKSLRDWLNQHLREERVPLDTALAIANSLLEGISILHSQSLIVGRLRPTSIFIDEDYNVQVAPDWVAHLPRWGNSAYLSPEQVKNEPPDARSDLYAFGLILYELVMGHHPFSAESDAIMAVHQIQSTPKSPRALRPEVSRSLEHLILKLLAKNPADRYASAEEVRRALDSFTVGANGYQPVISLIQTNAEIVGRETEQSITSEYLRLALTNRLQILFLAGDVGLGKTTLAQWIIARARAQGTIILTGHCLNTESQVPYQPFVEALENHFRSLATEADRKVFTESSGALYLAALVPALLSHLDHDTKPPSLFDQDNEVVVGEERTRLFRAVAEVLSQLAQNQPLIVFIDDLHWADLASLELLSYLAQALDTGLPVMFIVTYRNVELPIGHPLPATRQTLSNLTGFHELLLEPLNLSAIHKQLNRLFDQPVPTEVAKAIYKTTEGNPLFAQEIVHSLIQEGRAPAAGQLWEPEVISSLALPHTISDVLEHRLQYLSPEATETLQLAAIIGSEFPFTLLQVVAKENEETLLSHLDEALRLHLIRDLGHASQLGFTHGLIHRVLLNRVSLLQQRRLHRRIAQVLESMYAANPTKLAEIADELAYHFKASSESAKAIRYLVLAGQRAQRVHALTAARAHFEQAHALLDEAEISNDLHRDTLRGLADCQFSEAQYTDAQANYEKILKLLPEQGAEHISAEIMRLIAQTLDRRGGRQQALEWHEHALQHLRHSDQKSPEIEAMLLLDIGWSLFRVGEKNQAEQKYQEAHSLVENGKHPTIQATVYDRLGWLYLDRREFNRALEYVNHALELQRTSNDPTGAARSHNMLAMLYRLREDWDAAIQHAQAGLETAEKSGDAHNLMYLLHTCGTFETHHGDLQIAELHAQRLYNLAENAGELYHMAIATQLLGHINIERGSWRAAIDMLELSLQYLREIDEPESGLWTYAYLGEAWLGQGNFSQARMWAERTLELSQQYGDNTFNQITSSSIAYMVLGTTATHEKQWEQAYEYLSQALELSMVVPDYYEAARCYYRMGLLEHARGNRDNAETMLNTANETFTKLGAQLYQARIKQAQQTFTGNNNK